VVLRYKINFCSRNSSRICIL